MKPPYGKLHFCSRGVGKLDEGNTCFSKFFFKFFHLRLNSKILIAAKDTR